jgi:uncharacterized protein YjiK
VARCLAVLVLLIAMLAACDSTPAEGHDALALPKKLREVSAVTAVDDDTLACVQDEKGILFFLRLSDGKVTQKLHFGHHGDYEGLARVGEAYWVLRSDGELIELAQSGAELQTVGTWKLALPNHEFEGLAWDSRHGRLLIAPKDLSSGDKLHRDERRIYGFDLATHTLSPEPLVVVRIPELMEEAVALGFELPTRATHKGKLKPHLTLHITELTVDPQTDAIYLLSAIDHALLEVDRAGHLLSLQLLSPDDLPQPEGLAFLPDGRLVVASEGAGGAAAIRAFTVHR